MQGLRRGAQAIAGRLLRVLLLRLGAVPADAGGAGLFLVLAAMREADLVGRCEDHVESLQARHALLEPNAYLGRALPSYMNVIGLGPRIYPLSRRSNWNPAPAISSSMARFRWQPPERRFQVGVR
jgi:hypothetical protein